MVADLQRKKKKVKATASITVDAADAISPKRRKKAKAKAPKARRSSPLDEVAGAPLAKKTKKDKHVHDALDTGLPWDDPGMGKADSDSEEVQNAGTAALRAAADEVRPTADVGREDSTRESCGKSGKCGKGKGRDGKGKESKGKSRGKTAVADAARPSALSMLKVKKLGKKYTVSVALPASIVDNCQTNELKAILVGQIARYVTIYSVNEIVVYEDNTDASPSADTEGASRALAFFVRNLQYLETPQYLRRQLLPMHRDLRWVGLMAPLDAPHHLRRSELLPYREGAVLAADKGPEALEGEGCWLNCGLDQPVWGAGKEIPANVRVTLRLDERGEDHSGPRTGVAVSHREPTEKAGLYWGFQTRIADSLAEVFNGCPYGNYDLKIGTSERGEALGVSKLPKFKHLLLVFGGLGGLEEAVSDRNSGFDASDPAKLFTRYINLCPQQTSRTIRTEEALLIALASLSPHLPEH